MEFLKLLLESRKDDFKIVYGEKFTKKQQEEIIKTSSEIDSKHKYLLWLGEVISPDNFSEETEKSKDLLMRFKSISSNLTVKDINLYKSLDELSKALNDYTNKTRREIKQIDGADIIYDDDDYTVVAPKTYEASCYYGKGSKWCTASSDSNNHWYSKNKESKLFYFLSKKLQTNNQFYKVAILQFFNGKKEFWDARSQQFKSGWLIGTEYLNNILTIIDEYIKTNYPKEIEIFANEERAQKERERLARIEQERIMREKRFASQERRESDEWNPEDLLSDSEGAHAWALFKYLLSTENLDEKTPEDIERLDYLNSEIDRLYDLKNIYENEGRSVDDIVNQIDLYEDEVSDIEDKIDVYDIIPENSYGKRFVFTLPINGYERHEWTVIEDSEIHDIAFEDLKDLYDGNITTYFDKNFLRDFIDTEKVGDEARENYNYWVYDEPSSYLDDEDRELSKSQENEIKKLEAKIEKYQIFREKAIERQELYDTDSSQWNAIEIGINKLDELISDLEYEIEEIKENPDGDFPEDRIEEIINQLVDDAENNPLDYLDNLGVENYENYIDVDEIINYIIDSDGYYNFLNSYDGTGDEIHWNGNIYHIMNTNR